jgi:hypothetical protein
MRALPLVLVMTAGSTYGLGQPDVRLTCYLVQPGDTAARLAQHFTGNADNRHQPWFQIVDPATETFIPKSRYGLIQAGWHVCVATERVRRGFVPGRGSLVASAAVLPLRTGGPQHQTANYLSALWWAAPLLMVVSGLVLTWVVARKHIGERQARLGLMRAFGDRFISEFERPLFRRSTSEPAVKSRLRVSPRRQRLEVCIAPADGRSYPNLLDHRRNVEYDVERVLRLLRDASFTNGPLYAQGPWVVIPFRLDTGKQQEGVP